MMSVKMGTASSTVLVLVLGLTALASAPQTATAQTGTRERVDTTVAIGRGGTLAVSIHGGRVSVTAGSGSDVRIRGEANLDEMRIRGRSGAVALSTDAGMHRGGRADLDIVVPTGTRVVLEGFSAQFSVRGVKGEVNVESMSGSIIIADAVGKVTAESVSGRIEIDGVDGDVLAETVSGRISLNDIDGDITAETVSTPILMTRANSRTVRAESVQGSLTYDGNIDPAGNYTFATHAGRLTLAVPASAGATVILETFSGAVESDFPVTLESGRSRKDHESKFEFRIGDGRSRISIETFSGDIRIQRGTGRTPEE